MAQSSDLEMKGYYKERAPVYDRVYAYPERQADLRFLEDRVAEQFSELVVLEVAAGTGYWTKHISLKAHSILATDATQEALTQITQRKIDCAVTTQVVDAYALATLEQRFSGGFAGLWISHIPIERRQEWLRGFHRCLKPGAKVLWIDNSEAQSAQWPTTRTDQHGNSYQNRTTDSGHEYEVLKNFPTKEELTTLTAQSNSEFIQLDHFWLFEYTLT